jgi:hypothetical protein
MTTVSERANEIQFRYYLTPNSHFMISSKMSVSYILHQWQSLQLGNVGYVKIYTSLKRLNLTAIIIEAKEI